MKWLLICLLYACFPSESFKIDSLFRCINNNLIIYETYENKFSYVKSDYELDLFLSTFKSDSLEISYSSSGDFEKKDTIFIGSNIILVENKYDPLSISVSEFDFHKEHYLCLVGKAISASGSGVQVSFYTLLRIEGCKVVQNYSFQSRFGTLLNIGDFDNDNKLEYVKVINGYDNNTYIAKLYSIETNLQVGNYSFEISSCENDLFNLLKDNWINKIKTKCLKSDK